MARISLSVALLLSTCFFHNNLSNAFSVFMRKEEANQILRIHKRANNFLEEVLPGDLERECMEEKCSFEEAKEIFKSQEKTMEFWFDYKDLNPCKKSICKNGGICKVKHYLPSCTCPPRFGGSHCEIEKIECWYKNGDCWQYCQDTEQGLRVVCSCAAGYALGEDRKSCTPSERFPCGLMKKSTRSFGNGSAEDNEMETWDTAWRNETAAPEGLFSGNETLFQASSAGWNHTRPQEKMEGDFDQTEGNFTEWDPHSWLNFNYTDKEDYLKVVGGSFCRPGDCPWQVLVQNRRGFGFCGGSLISSQWVLTAAHCLDTIVPHQITVGDFDKYQRDRDEQKVGVKQYWKHPHYEPDTYNNDIALIRLTSDVVFNKNVFPICLPFANLATLLMEEGATGLVSGWGATHAKGRLTRFLLKVRLPIVSLEACKQTTEKLITDNMFCAGYVEEAQDACKGDSGGPFAVTYRGTWFLLGIVSWGEGCAEVGKYGVYTQVSNYISWIKEIIESETDPVRF